MHNCYSHLFDLAFGYCCNWCFSITSWLVGSHQLLEEEQHLDDEDDSDYNYHDEVGSDSSENETDDEVECDEQNSSVGEANSSKWHVIENNKSAKYQSKHWSGFMHLQLNLY